MTTGGRSVCIMSDIPAATICELEPDPCAMVTDSFILGLETVLGLYQPTLVSNWQSPHQMMFRSSAISSESGLTHCVWDNTLGHAFHERSPLDTQRHGMYPQLTQVWVITSV